MNPLRVISLGAGVQSTTMALMAAHGEIGPMPDAAIFADTGDEPEAVYAHLRWLTSPNVLPFPVKIATHGPFVVGGPRRSQGSAPAAVREGRGPLDGRGQRPTEPIQQRVRGAMRSMIREQP